MTKNVSYFNTHAKPIPKLVFTNIMLPNSSSIDINIKNLLAAHHKETQTSKTALKDSSTATSSENVNTSDKGSLKVFEFSELVQDPKHPKEITIIKDVFAEEIHDHNTPSGSISDDAIANRYTYCREVIKPYLKDYPKDCPVSDEQLIRDALEAAHEDFPDYEPCFEAYDGKQKDIEEKRNSLIDKSVLKYFSKLNDGSSESSVSTKDKATSKSSVTDKKDRKSPKSSNSKRNSPTSSLRSNMDPDKVCPPEAPKVRDRRCPKKSKCPPSLEPCISDDPPRPPSACNNRNSPGGSSPCKAKLSVETCEDTPAAPKKEKSCEQRRSDMRESSRKSIFQRESPITVPVEERKKTMMEAHSETIATIKTAVEDFFGKVYQSTKDAVTVIRTESARHLGRITAKKSGSSSSDLFPQKVHENKSTETITSFNYFRSTDNPDLKNQGTNNEETEDNLSKAGQAIGKIFATVDSTISMLSDHIDLEKVSSLLKFESKEESSPYDQVPNSEETETTSTSLPGSVFTAIKSKIVSMFSEGENEGKTADTSRSSSEQNLGIKSSKKRF